MKLKLCVSILIFWLAKEGAAGDIRIEEASVQGETLYLAVTTEKRSNGRSFIGEQPLSELKALSIEIWKVSLKNGRTEDRWKTDLKRELKLDNSVQIMYYGMSGENLYLAYFSALYRGPFHGRTNQQSGVAMVNRKGVNRIGTHPKEWSVYEPQVSLPMPDGSLRVMGADMMLSMTTNGMERMNSPMQETRALGLDWRDERTMLEVGSIGTFGVGAESRWYLKFPPGRPRLTWDWDEPMELVLDSEGVSRVMPIPHRYGAVIWDGGKQTWFLSLGRKSGGRIGVDSADGSRRDLGPCAGEAVADPTARTVVVFPSSGQSHRLDWGPDQRFSEELRLAVFEVIDGAVVRRDLKVVLD